ncbi:hypothetical protein pb186bvf_009800 [Paramecium bursaria]
MNQNQGQITIDLLEEMAIKILLVQIEVKDHRSLEDHELEYTVKIMQRKANDLRLNIKQNMIQDIYFTDTQNIFTKLTFFSLNYINATNSSFDHNHILIKRNQFIQKSLGQRVDDSLKKIQNLKLQKINQIFKIDKKMIQKTKLNQISKDD